MLVIIIDTPTPPIAILELLESNKDKVLLVGCPDEPIADYNTIVCEELLALKVNVQPIGQLEEYYETILEISKFKFPVITEINKGKSVPHKTHVDSNRCRGTPYLN